MIFQSPVFEASSERLDVQRTRDRLTPYEKITGMAAHTPAGSGPQIWPWFAGIGILLAAAGAATLATRKKSR